MHIISRHNLPPTVIVRVRLTFGLLMQEPLEEQEVSKLANTSSVDSSACNADIYNALDDATIETGAHQAYHRAKYDVH